MNMLEYKEKFNELRLWLSNKLWDGKNKAKTFDKRFEIFVILGIILIAISKLIYLWGITIPNLELIIPTLTVIGIFSIQFRGDGTWYQLDKYLGILALGSIFVIDLLIWGIRPVYLFTWTTFVVCWFLAKKKNLSFRSSYKDIAFGATITTAFLIILYDGVTAFGTWLLWGSFTSSSLVGVYIAQIPFTLYHLGSLVFVPPLVAIGKVMTKVKEKTAIRQSIRIPQKVRN